MVMSAQRVNISRSVLSSTESGDIHHHHGASCGEVSEAFKLLITKVAATARHNSLQDVESPKCHPGTRVAILASLQEWVATSSVNPYTVKWLHGSAGAGKSAIMRTFAEWLTEQKYLLAEFFFFKSDPRRNGLPNVVATLAYQIATSIPLSRRYIEQAVAADPLVFTLSIMDQIKSLVIAPLHRARSDAVFDLDTFCRVILIDGLDECGNDKDQRELLQAICQMLKDVQLPILVLVASRPEHHLRNAFDLGDLNELSTKVALDDSFHPDKDIRKFYDDKFREMRSTHPLRSSIPAVWPPPETIGVLVKKASGQFIYASTTIGFSGSSRHNPVERLEIVLGVREAPGLQPFQQLDLLYLTILRNINPEDREQALKILGIILTAGTVQFNTVSPRYVKIQGTASFWTPSFLEALLGLEKGAVRRLLFSLESLLTINDDEEAVRVLHTSLSDFLFDRSRSGEFFVSKGAILAELSILTICHARDAPYSNSLVLHYEDQLPFYMENATPSPDLREFIVQFDIKSLIDCRNLIFGSSSSPENPAYGVRILAPTFLSGIQKSSLHGATDIHEAHYLKFLTATYQILNLYQRRMPLMYLAIAASVSFDKTFTMAMVPFQDLCEYIGLPLSMEMVEFDYSAGFDFLHPNQHTDSTPHLFQIVGLLTDPPLLAVRKCCTCFAAHMLSRRTRAGHFEFSGINPDLPRLFYIVLPQLLQWSVLPRDLVRSAIKELRDLDDNPQPLLGFVDYTSDGNDSPTHSLEDSDQSDSSLHDLDDSDSSDDSDSPPKDLGRLHDAQVALVSFKQIFEEARRREEEPEEVRLPEVKWLNGRVPVWFALLGIFLGVGYVSIHMYLEYSPEH